MFEVLHILNFTLAARSGSREGQKKHLLQDKIKDDKIKHASPGKNPSSDPVAYYDRLTKHHFC